MNAVSEWIEFLQGNGLATAVSATREARSALVTRCLPFSAPAPQCVSWLAASGQQNADLAGCEFVGSVLLASSSARWSAPLPFALIVCANPRLSFARAVGHFFANELQIDFPPNGRPEHAGQGVVVGPGVVFGPRVSLADGVRIGPNTVLANCTVGPRSCIGANCTIGLPGFGYERDEDGRSWRFPHLGEVRIGADVEIGSNTCIDRGALGATIVDDGCKIDNLVHVAHNVQIGRGALVIANAMLGGSSIIGDGAWVAPSASLMNKISVGAGATVGMGAVVIRSVAAGDTVAGNPAKKLERRS
jgi:UDP-3-O-[3-hydroxymyristoyl] glucosamine N-acyltransferase